MSNPFFEFKTTSQVAAEAMVTAKQKETMREHIAVPCMVGDKEGFRVVEVYSYHEGKTDSGFMTLTQYFPLQEAAAIAAQLPGY